MEINKYQKSATVCVLGIVVCFFSCSLKTYKLLDGRTRVPVDTSIFTKRMKFEPSLLRIIDTGIIYEELNRRYGELSRLNNQLENLVYGTYRFYGDGRVSEFAITKQEPFTPLQFDPRYNGHQGVYYLEKGKIRMQLCAQVDQRGGFGLLYSTLRISGDTLFEKRDDLSYEEIYIKRSLPDSFFVFQPYW